MHALRNLLASMDNKTDSVKDLLACLPDKEFPLDVHICSFGGVGSTELSNFLNRHGITTNLLTDEDNLKHINKPPVYGESRPKCVLYMYGDPLVRADRFNHGWLKHARMKGSIASHYRRGHAFHQALKTSGQRLREDTFPSNLRTYVQDRQDLFGYSQHFHQWLNSETTYPVVMVRYERMWEPDVCSQMMRLVCGHIKTPEEIEVMSEAFCRGRRQRLSEVPPECQQGMYEDLLAAMDVLPPLLVRSAAGQIIEIYGTALES